MRKMTKRSTAIVAASVIAVGGAGAAWAAWTVNGGGTAQASASSAKQLVVSSVAVSDLNGGLYPGGSTAITIKVKNKNPFPTRLTSVTLGAVTVDAEHPGCQVANVQVVRNPALPADVTVAAGTEAAPFEKDIVLANAISMIADAEDGCQGAGFTVAATISAQSAASNPVT